MSQLDLLQLLGGTLAKGALLLLLAALAVRLRRRHSAAGRYAIWTATFAGLLMLPALSAVLPPLDPPSARSSDRMTGERMMIVPPAMAEEGHSRAMVRAMARYHGDMDMQMSDGLDTGDGIAWRRAARAATPWLLGAWLAGVIVVLFRLVRDVRRIAGVSRRAAPLRRGPLHQLSQDVAAELGVSQRVRVALSRELAVPVSWGLFRPVVLLPAASRRWDPERRRVVLRHEMAHIRRADYAGHLVIEVACALHWVNPLAWRAARRARQEQEQACDDRVLALGTGAVEYAEHLLDIARAFTRPIAPARGALAMAEAATLPERMRSILDVGLDHRPAGRGTVLAVAAASMLFGVPTAAIHPWGESRRERELVALLDEPDAVARRDALWTLGARGATGARDAITLRLRDEDPATRGVAAWALGHLGERSALAPLTSALRDQDGNVREMAVLALGELGDPRAVPALQALRHDPEPGVRSVMTVALRRIGGEEAGEALAHLLRSDADVHTRVMAAGALRKFESSVRVAALEGALADPEPAVRANAASSLGQLGGSASVPALMDALAHESDPDATDALIHALGVSHDPRATDGLILVLADTLPALRESAAKVLGELGDERAVEPLIAATRDPDHEVRLTAVWALDALRQGR